MSRPAPSPKITAVILAAGSSRRMGANKLLATLNGTPLVRIAAEAAVASKASPVIVVTGHEAELVSASLAGLPLTRVLNPTYADGLAGSLAAGLANVPADAEGVVILLGDMPKIDAALVDRLIAAFVPGHIVVPVANGRRGNPVLWSRDFIPQLKALAGDVGGRGIIEANGGAVIEVPADTAVALDVDTPEALSAIGGKLH